MKIVVARVALPKHGHTFATKERVAHFAFVACDGQARVIAEKIVSHTLGDVVGLIKNLTTGLVRADRGIGAAVKPADGFAAWQCEAQRPWGPTLRARIARLADDRIGVDAGVTACIARIESEVETEFEPGVLSGVTADIGEGAGFVWSAGNRQERNQ